MDESETGQSQDSGKLKRMMTFDDYPEEEDNFYFNLNVQDLAEVNDYVDHHTVNRSLLANDTITDVVEEIIRTEKDYISVLKNVVENYIPHVEKRTPSGLIGKTKYLFGNVEQIYENAKEFLLTLENSPKDANSVAHVFINSASEFELYPIYSKNKHMADMYLEHFGDVVERRQKQLRDDLGLAQHLLAPINRLGKYVLFLERIEKELNKRNRSSEDIYKAKKIIKTIVYRGNDYIAIFCIKNSEIDLTTCGSFIKRSHFDILKPKKFKSMVFLFDQVIVFTEGEDELKYVDSIEMKDLALEPSKESTILTLVKFTRSKTSSFGATYVLKAENSEIKYEWIAAIEKKLWEDFAELKAK